MNRALVNIKLGLFLLCLWALGMAHASEFDPKVFLPKLVGVKVMYEPMTAQEVLAMDPVCLEIGMGTAVAGSWGYPGMTREALLAILSQPQYASWALIGPRETAQWLHHYCWGKVSKFRYFSAQDRNKRMGYMRNWRLNMQYCIDDPAKHGINWPHIPLMYKEIAESYFYDHAYQKAIIAAGKAISMDPKLAEAYPILADSYEKLGKTAKALEVVTEGLKQGNQTIALKRRFKELGGKMPYPGPNVVEAVTPEPPQAESLLAEPVAQSPLDATENKNPSEGAGNGADSRAVPEQTPKPPDNPYCRFCP